MQTYELWAGKTRVQLLEPFIDENLICRLVQQEKESIKASGEYTLITVWGRHSILNRRFRWLVDDVVRAIEKMSGMYMEAERKKLCFDDLLMAPCDILLISNQQETPDQKRIKELETEVKKYKALLLQLVDAQSEINKIDFEKIRKEIQ